MVKDRTLNMFFLPLAHLGGKFSSGSCGKQTGDNRSFVCHYEYNYDFQIISLTEL